MIIPDPKTLDEARAHHQSNGMSEHLPDCDVNDINPDGITKPCNCFDKVWPGEENIEIRWKAQGGIDFDGMCWSTPRMQRISQKVVERWKARP